MPGPWVRQGTSCLTSPLEPGYHWLIGTQQVDYIILEHFHENTEEEGLLMQVDLEKAFDSVEHNFLFKVIKKQVDY